MCSTRVAMARMKYTSWLMKTRVPMNSLKAATSASMLATSRWVVGSSINSKLGGSRSNFTRAKRVFSPPLSTATFLKTSSSRKRKHPSSDRMYKSVTRAAVSEASSSTVRSGWSISVRYCEKYPTLTRSPRSRSPAWGVRLPARSLMSVDLPEPLGPTSTVRSPRCASNSKPV